MDEQFAASQRQQIKLCAVLVERDLAEADRLESAGKPIAAAIRRDIASLWSGMAFIEAKTLAAGHPRPCCVAVPTL